MRTKYENMPMHNRLGDAVLASTDDLCFGSKIRKIPMYTPVLLHEIGVYKGVYITQPFLMNPQIDFFPSYCCFKPLVVDNRQIIM